jgi:DNA invertase Pin-like site-specific DNA recombinase
MITKQDKYTAGLYCRLSSDDGSEGESGSIQTQKTLLTRYCMEHGFAIGDIYSDDGYSGTNFNRPDFIRMLADIDEGKINLVVVKDLSRFGREYAQMGIYIEHHFEERDIRFIAVGENIDTLNGTDNILMPLTNVINSLYAKDCSRKIKAAHHALAKDGKFIGSHAPFGYIKDPSDKHHLLIDPEAAETVRKVFLLFSEGVGYVRMTKILREQKVLNPQAYFNKCNPDYYTKSEYWRKPFDWHATSVRAILNNEAYLGHAVFGKTKVKGGYSKKRVPAAEGDWILVENMHEPIVSQELWDTVHKIMKNRRRECKNGETQMFAGLVRCGSCGSALNASFDAKKGKFKNFSCWVYKNYGKERCSSHSIGWKTLNTLVLDDIRFHARVAALQSAKYKQMLTDARAGQRKAETEKNKRMLGAVGKRIDELDRIIGKLYEDSALGKIPEQRAQALMIGYESEQRELIDKREALSSEISKAEETRDNVQNFVSVIRKYTNIQELNAAILNELIDRIIVHEKWVDECGEINQMVEIHYRFIGYVTIADWMDWTGSIEGFPKDELDTQIPALKSA